MKLAIPVKTNRENPAVSPLFGKAKWFAIVDDEGTTIVPNEQSGGGAVIAWLHALGVKCLLIQEMGQTPYEKCKAYGDMQLFHTGFDRILLEDAIEAFKANRLTPLNDETIGKVLAHHEKKHPHHDGHHTHA